ncbi:GNAT family N-acetyltransferase [Streptomyces gilvosporeus]|uniref:GNAT family N-acetyltransferase n=1 Tax=Streptomyces gilvosporeus TaxID=553510 RepID=A0A1V0TL58_9ACTN|nr:GNAT family N-acetyltransferase [Streptomyces gilvosporeus]ARF53610.1 GNAT family N-acetyltransferase [Streptomyces gilvosporeus]
MIPELIRTWVTGWAASRRTPPPAETPWGLALDIGNPRQVARHVLPEPDELAVRATADSVTVPHTWITLPVEPAEAAPWLPRGWVADEEESGHLMATDLRVTNPTAPGGYTASTQVHYGVVYVRVDDATGAQAATGQMALLGEAVVLDRVVTEEAHRRRGLGSFVMRTLADRAVSEGATLGVLGATDDGRALYETLGWKRYAALADCIYRP